MPGKARQRFSACGGQQHPEFAVPKNRAERVMDKKNNSLQQPQQQQQQQQQVQVVVSARFF